MSDEKKKNFNLLKPIGITIAAGTLLVIGDSIDLGQRINNTYNQAKERIVNVLTQDVTERSEKLLDRLPKEKDLSEHYVILEKTVNNILYHLPDSSKVNVRNNLYESISLDLKYNLISIDMSDVPDSIAVNIINERVSNLDNRYKRNIISETSKEVFNQTKDRTFERFRDTYNNVRQKFYRSKD